MYEITCSHLQYHLQEIVCKAHEPTKEVFREPYEELCREFKLDHLEEIDHLLFMLNQIMSCLFDERKAARWIGWVLKSCEDLGILTNKESQDFIRLDIMAGNDRRLV